MGCLIECEDEIDCKEDGYYEDEYCELYGKFYVHYSAEDDKYYLVDEYGYYCGILVSDDYGEDSD